MLPSAHPPAATPDATRPGISTFAFSAAWSGKFTHHEASRARTIPATRPPGLVTRTISASILSAVTLLQDGTRECHVHTAVGQGQRLCVALLQIEGLGEPVLSGQG